MENLKDKCLTGLEIHLKVQLQTQIQEQEFEKLINCREHLMWPILHGINITTRPLSADQYITTRVLIIPTVFGLTLLAKPYSDFPKQGNSIANIYLKLRPDSASGTADSST